MGEDDLTDVTQGSDEELYYVERIVKHRVDKKGNVQYNVRWQGWGPSGDTWEPRKNLEGCKGILEAYEAKHKLGKFSSGNKRAAKRPADVMSPDVGIDHVREGVQDRGHLKKERDHLRKDRDHVRKERERPSSTTGAPDPLPSSSAQSLGQTPGQTGAHHMRPKASTSGKEFTGAGALAPDQPNSPSAQLESHRESVRQYKGTSGSMRKDVSDDASTESKRSDGLTKVEIVRPGSKEDNSEDEIWANLETIGPRFIKEGNDMNNVFYMCTFRNSNRSCYVHKTLLREFAPQKLIDFYDSRLRLKKKAN